MNCGGSGPIESRPGGQQKIWAYYQNRAPEMFASAVPRLRYLLGRIERRLAAARPDVLNIGIGSGWLERQALAHGWIVHALDPDPASAERLKRAGADARVGSIEQLPFQDLSMDFVVASEVLEHLDDRQRSQGLAEIHRVLRIGGWFLGTVPFAEDLAASQVVCPHCGETFHRWGHMASFDLKNLADELGSWFAVHTIGRTAFVSFTDRSLTGKLKGVLRVVLARCGQMIAVPTIYWQARKVAAIPGPNQTR